LAYECRRTRRKSSDDLPENIGPTITSTRPFCCAHANLKPPWLVSVTMRPSTGAIATVAINRGTRPGEAVARRHWVARSRGAARESTHCGCTTLQSAEHAGATRFHIAKCCRRFGERADRQQQSVECNSRRCSHFLRPTAWPPTTTDQTTSPSRTSSVANTASSVQTCVL